MALDGYDQELLENFRVLTPLLTQAREYKRASEEERENKRFKPENLVASNNPEASEAAKSSLDALRTLVQLVLSHERSLQQVAKQDSFVLFISNTAQGSLPMIANMAATWKKQVSDAQTQP